MTLSSYDIYTKLFEGEEVWFYGAFTELTATSVRDFEGFVVVHEAADHHKDAAGFAGSNLIELM